jgi:prepilin-type N-terminal cleavage/methylation domain-containing protein
VNPSLPAPECSIYFPELDNNPGIIINPKRKSLKGFTLIELSIVLVVIGLIVGGILVGQSLINAAAVRAQVTQTEKYNTAANTFFEKYGALPGDICGPIVTNFGFKARAGGAGRGDCNGVVQGICYDCGNVPYGWNQAGETTFFWEDLSSANLIDSSFTTAFDGEPSSNITLTSSPSFSSYLPPAKIGQGNYVYVWGENGSPTNGINYFGISVPSLLIPNGQFTSAVGLTVAQAYAIDQKIDDGLPTTGRVQTQYDNGGIANSPNTATAGGTSASCYDTTTKLYSIAQSNGANVNCALSFRMQAGD